MVLAAAAGATAANALWRVERPLPVQAVTTGDLAVSASWQTAPVWTDLYPGGTSPDATLLVTATSPGETLRWGLQVSTAVAADFAAYATVQAWIGACGSGTLLPAAGYAPAGGLLPGQQVPICLRLTLAPNAPATLSGRPIAPRITVTAVQKGV